ncbi:MAG: hypothetical protein FWC44_02530 [Methanomassiliicoccaceae archaeon]|nr:hypothetical protein [Methanomassiliicoccaceae archaeon]
MFDLKSRSSIFTLIVLIAGLAGIISMFLTWESFFDGYHLWIYSGWGYISDLIESPFYVYVVWVPLFVLIFSLVATIFAALSLFKSRTDFGVIMILSGIFWVIAAVAFILYTAPGYSMVDYAGIGFYLAFAAGILVLLFGLLRMAVKDN